MELNYREKNVKGKRETQFKNLKNKLNSNEGHFMTSFPSFFSGTGQSLPLWKCYTEALPGRVTSFTWSTASDFSLELISNENSSTTITIIIIMGVRIYYVPIFSKTLFVLTHLNKIVRLLFYYFQLRNTWICFLLIPMLTFNMGAIHTE